MHSSSTTKRADYVSPISPARCCPPERRPGHLRTLLEVLFHQKTQYLETDYERLYATVRAKIKQRSLLILFTNFENPAGNGTAIALPAGPEQGAFAAGRILRNTELHTFLDAPADTTADVYNQTIAEKFQQEKRQIVLECSATAFRPAHAATPADGEYAK